MRYNLKNHSIFFYAIGGKNCLNYQIGLLSFSSKYVAIYIHLIQEYIFKRERKKQETVNLTDI